MYGRKTKWRLTLGRILLFPQRLSHAKCTTLLRMAKQTRMNEMKH